MDSELRLSKYWLTSQVIEDVENFVELILDLTHEFYLPVAEEETLGILKEDLFEIATTSVIKGDLYKIVIAFFELETFDVNEKLIEKYIEFISVKPQNLGIDPYFCLGSVSPLWEEYEKMANAINN